MAEESPFGFIGRPGEGTKKTCSMQKEQHNVENL